MYETSVGPSAADLAESTVELEEWDLLRLRDYLDAVLDEELGTSRPAAPPSSLPAGELAEWAHHRRAERRAVKRVLRLVPRGVDSPTASASDSVEAA